MQTCVTQNAMSPRNSRTNRKPSEEYLVKILDAENTVDREQVLQTTDTHNVMSINSGKVFEYRMEQFCKTLD